MTKTSQFSNITLLLFFWGCFDSLLNFRYWSKFHVNIITGSGVITILFDKGLTSNLEIGNTLVRVFPNIWRQGLVMDTKFDTNISNKMLLNAAKCQGYKFYSFQVTIEKPKEEECKIIPHSPTQIKIRDFNNSTSIKSPSQILASS